MAKAVTAAGQAIELPALGWLLAAPIAATLAGAGAFGAAGTLIGASIGSGMSGEPIRDDQTDAPADPVVMAD